MYLDFLNILKLYGVDLQKCIENEAEVINNIFAAFSIQNSYFRATFMMITDSIGQCVNSNIMSSSAAGIREITAACLNNVRIIFYNFIHHNILFYFLFQTALKIDFTKIFNNLSLKIQTAIIRDQVASMSRLTRCQTNAKAAYNADLVFFYTSFDLCLATNK